MIKSGLRRYLTGAVPKPLVLIFQLRRMNRALLFFVLLIDRKSLHFFYMRLIKKCLHGLIASY